MTRQMLISGSLLAVALSTAALANYTLEQLVVVANGGLVQISAGALTVDATIGEPSTGLLQSSSYEVTVGFWGVYPLYCLGDLNEDFAVTDSDLGLLLSSFGACPASPNYLAPAGQLAGDACVTDADLGVLLSMFGSSCAD